MNSKSPLFVPSYSDDFVGLFIEVSSVRYFETPSTRAYVGRILCPTMRYNIGFPVLYIHTLAYLDTCISNVLSTVTRAVRVEDASSWGRK